MIEGMEFSALHHFPKKERTRRNIFLPFESHIIRLYRYLTKIIWNLALDKASNYVTVL